MKKKSGTNGQNRQLPKSIVIAFFAWKNWFIIVVLIVIVNVDVVVVVVIVVGVIIINVDVVVVVVVVVVIISAIVVFYLFGGFVFALTIGI